MAIIWTRQDKFNQSKGFRRIHWGAQSKVLDTELTELQKMLTNQTNILTKRLVNDGFINKGALVYAAASGGTLTVPLDTIVVDGYTVTLEDTMVITGILSSTVYLAMWEQEVAYGDTLYRDGNLSGGQVIADNGIYDAEIAMETSRRFQTQVQLVTSNADATKKYLAVATISGAGAVTDNRVQSVINVPPVNVATPSALGTVQIAATPTAGNPTVSTRVANVIESQLTTTAATNVLSYTPSAPGNFVIYVSVRVMTAATNITVEIDYTDVGGAQVNMLFPLASVSTGTHMLNHPLFINAVAGTAIIVKVTAGTANQAFISSSIVGV